MTFTGTTYHADQGGTQKPTLPLDIHASNVSPHPQPVWPPPSQPAPNHAPDGPETDPAYVKKARHKLRRVAGKVLGYGWRTATCGQKALGDMVTLHHHDQHSHYAGIETCGSVWNCPVCAAKITEHRREEIEAILQAHRNAGGLAFMATLTIPHYKFQRCMDLKKGVAGAWRKVKAGKPWQRARDSHQWLGDVRALEITHGENGWHPHLHVLIFFEPGTSKDTAYSFGGWLFDAWAGAIKRSGFGTCQKSAFTYEPVNADTGAAEYVGKWGAAFELAKGHIKQGRNGGRTPWQILGDISGTQNSADIELFREYAKAFFRARQLTWSRDLRNRYDLEPETSDQEVAEPKSLGETQTATLTKPLFKAIAAKGLTAHFLGAQEAGGLDGVLRVLTAYDIPWRLSEAPGLERGRIVPLISLGAEIPRKGPPSCRGGSGDHISKKKK